jgi:amino acid permease
MVPSFIFSYTIYLFIAVFGCLSFAGVEKLSDNIINMYPKGTAVLIGKICISLLVLLSYPLQVNIALL